MMKIFILDDEIHKVPRSQIKDALKDHQLTLAISCQEGQRLYSGPYDLLLLDHDMRGFFEMDPHYANTGFKFATWLVNKELTLWKKPPVFLHSQNDEGRNRMDKLLTAHKFFTKNCPFSMDYIKMLKEIDREYKEAMAKIAVKKPESPISDEEWANYCC